MKPLTPIGSPSPLRLLNKGPDYLRRQMDSGGRGRSVSAVERLEADKAKYVKSQQVINTKQEPVLAPCATPPPLPRRPLTVPGTSTPRTSPRRPHAENEEDAKKENRHVVDVEEHNRSNTNRAAPVVALMVPLVAPHSAPILRRSTGKRMLRPDSLLIYRQKKECKSPGGSAHGETKGYSFVRRLFQGSMREKGSSESPLKTMISEERTTAHSQDSRMSWSNDKDSVDTVQVTRGLCKTDGRPPLTPSSPCVLDRTKTGVGGSSEDPWKPVVLWRPGGLRRSKSDLRFRCSLALSDKERFFDYCGLDLELVERLGPENFPSGASSADTLSLALRSVSGGGASEASEFSRHSGEGLFQEELTEQLPSGVSIIERNARVIKWLYGCKNAAQEGPKESTV